MWGAWCRWTPGFRGLISYRGSAPRDSGALATTHSRGLSRSIGHSSTRAAGGPPKPTLRSTSWVRPLVIWLIAAQAGVTGICPWCAISAFDRASAPIAPDVVVADKSYSHPLPGTRWTAWESVASSPKRRDQIKLRERRKPRRRTPGRRSRHPPRPLCRRTRLGPTQAAIATRYDKHARLYRAGLVLAAIVMFLL